MINVINVLRKGNPPRRSIDILQTRPRVPDECPAIPDRALIAGRLASFVERVGARLFAMNDAEALWRGWEIIELRAGMSRRYRDRRFNTRCVHAGMRARPSVPQAPGIHEDGYDGTLGGECS